MAVRITRAPAGEQEYRSSQLQRSKKRLMVGMVGTINCTPMVDLIFNLLVYFLCVGLINIPEGTLPAKLPSTHGEAQALLPLAPIEVRLDPADATGGARIELRPLGLRMASMPPLYAELRRLAASRDFGVDAPVILLPARQVRVEFVADAYNAAYQAGFHQIVFGERTD